MGWATSQRQWSELAVLATRVPGSAVLHLTVMQPRSYAWRQFSVGRTGGEHGIEERLDGTEASDSVMSGWVR